MTPITLSSSELEEVLIKVNRGRKTTYAAGRICKELAKNHSQRTKNVNEAGTCVNISDQVRRSINPRIIGLGLFVACIRPITPFRNIHKQETGEMKWSFYRYPKASNDPAYDLDKPESMGKEV